MNGIAINDTILDVEAYREFHNRRVHRTLETLESIGSRRIIEVGSHPWVMTAALVEHDRFEVAATISAEEVTHWPDEIPLEIRDITLRAPSGRVASFPNYSVNVERTLFDVNEQADTVIACEIIEHLIRSPHVLLLNANRWLPHGGHLIVTTPNGEQFANPFRRGSQTPALRSHVYERHAHLFTLEGLVDLVDLCGFRVRSAERWDVYDRAGFSTAYGWLARIPLPYFRAKFSKTLAVMAVKEVDRQELPRTPRAYSAPGTWEHILLEPHE